MIHIIIEKWQDKGCKKPDFFRKNMSHDLLNLFPRTEKSQIKHSFIVVSKPLLPTCATKLIVALV